MKLPFQTVHAQVSGLNQAVAAEAQTLCHFNIGSRTKPRLRIEASAFVIPHVAGNLPSFTVPQNSIKDLPAHLSSKTAGEANEIIAKFPLINDGFASSWIALCERFENKRLWVTSQLKILLNLSTVNSESGAAIKDLQITIQECLTALEHSEISTSSPFADCILLFPCSTKLPKLTLSLWEQSLSDKSEIPAWQDLSNFLNERYRTLEAIEDVKPVSNPQNSSSSTSRNNQGHRRVKLNSSLSDYSKR